MTKSLPPDSLWDHPQTPPLHLYSPPSHSLPPSPISALSQPQFSLIRPCSSPSPPSSPGGTSRLFSTPPWVPRVLFWWHLEPRHKWELWPECWYWYGVHTTAWVWCTQYRQGSGYEKENYQKIIISIIINYSSWGVHQAILPSTHTSLAGVRTPHLNCGISAVLPPRLFEGPLSLFISGGNFFSLGPRNLGWPLPLTSCPRAVGSTSLSSSSSPPPPQLSASQLSPRPSSPLPS